MHPLKILSCPPSQELFNNVVTAFRNGQILVEKRLSHRDSRITIFRIEGAPENNKFLIKQIKPGSLPNRVAGCI